MKMYMIHILIYTFWVYFKFMPRYEPCVIYIYVYTAIDILVILSCNLIKVILDLV